MADLFSNIYNPDVLSCLANLSNDEVFTPPSIANQMLNLLPQELFQDPNTTFLDPCCKSGVFLREIARRLIVGLEDKIPNLQERLNHIYHNQIFGIAITELTSLLSRRSVYCSKYASSEYSVSHFNNIDGNIRFKRIEHSWSGNKCIYCGASKKIQDRGYSKETHAYEFIHKFNLKEFNNMKFDVIIGNPPYNLDDGGNGRSATAIYQLFVDKAKKLNPRYISMIIPSRWFTGGKKLDNFRITMLNDDRISILVDYENFRDVFPGVDLAGGACYFLWDRNYKGDCTVFNKTSNSENSRKRKLNEFPVFIRSNMAIDFIHKMKKWNKNGISLSNRISTRKPFGLPTNYEPRDTGIPCWFKQRIGLKFANPKDIKDPKQYLNKWKFLIPAVPIAGQTDFSKPVGFFYEGNTRIAEPGQCCTETWLVAGAFESKEETENYKSYLLTKTVRFLLLQTVVSQHIST